MTTFSDNFNRADGPIGAAWAGSTSSYAIDTNRLKSSTAGFIYPADAADTGDQDVSIDAMLDGFYGFPATYLYLKSNDSGSYSYRVVFSKSGNNVQVQIVVIINNADTWHGPVTHTGKASGSYRFRATYTDGTIAAYVDGTQELTWDDSQLAAYGRYGLYTNAGNSLFDNFEGGVAPPPTFEVSPTLIGDEDGTVLLTLTGGNTSWTVGVPGDPEFEADAGTLSMQAVYGSGSATVMFAPPTAPATVTITDPSTSLTATIQIIPGHYNGGLGGSGLSSLVIGYLERSAAAEDTPTILNRQTLTTGDVAGIEVRGAFGDLLLGVRKGATPSGDNAAIADAIITLWRLLNGGVEDIVGPYPEVSTSSVKEDLDHLRARWWVGEGLDPWTADQMVTALGGDPLASHQDILDAIAALPAADNQEVLDAIAAAQGDPLATIKAVLDLVFQLGTVSNYTLGDVLAAIAALPQTAPDLSPITDKLNLIQPSTAVSLSTVSSDVGEVAVQISDVQEVVDDIKALIEALPVPADPVPTAPVWPGEASVTLGDSSVLADQLHIEAEMDGVLVAVTTPPTRTGLRQIGGALYDYGVGEIAFETDRGEIEPWQYLGFRSAIFTPKTMARAAGVRFRVLAGAAGTATPWVRS